MLNYVIVVVPDGPTVMVPIKDKEHSFKHHYIVVNYAIVVPDGPTLLVLVKDKEHSFKTSSHRG